MSAQNAIVQQVEAKSEQLYMTGDFLARATIRRCRTRWERTPR